MNDSERDPSPGGRGPSWLLVLGCFLAGAGVLRETGQSQAPGSTSQTPPTATLPTVSMPTVQGGGTADSNDRMIAVTGTDITGSSILYVIDSRSPHIAVYQAAGGSASMNMIKLVAARRIDLDLRLDGFNDKSQHSFKDLERAFIDQGLKISEQ